MAQVPEDFLSVLNARSQDIFRKIVQRYLERGLKYAAPTGPRIEQILGDDPLLLRTPVVRDGARATVGYCPDVWQSWIAEASWASPP